jgi:hypothetical protein
MEYVAVRVRRGQRHGLASRGIPPHSTQPPSRGAGSSNLYYADLWIMPTIGSKRALAVAIAAMESA